MRPVSEDRTRQVLEKPSELTQLVTEHHIDSTHQVKRRQTFRYLKRRAANIFVLGSGDALALACGLVTAGLVRYLLKGRSMGLGEFIERGGSMIPSWWWVLIVAWLVGAVALNLLPGWGLGAVEELRRVTWLVCGIFGVVAISLFLGKSGETASRLTVTSAMLVSGPLIILFRHISKNILLRSGRWGLPTVVYGGSETACLAIRALNEDPGLGFIPVGVFEDDKTPGADTVEGVPVLGTLEQNSRIAPAAVLALSDSSRHDLVRMLEGPLSNYHRVIIIPDLMEAPSLWVQPMDVGGILGLEVSVNLHDPFSRFLKRAVELAVVALSSPVWFPACILIAFLIWIEDRHDPIFAQKRVGKSNDTFQTYKFRTMVPDAKTALETALRKNDDLREEWNANFKLRNDPRITSIGKLLRKMSLDELPQLYNVLIGDMSLVGPRPLPIYHHAQLPEHIRNLRERVRPGITGLWQVSGRSEVGNEGMIRWDGYYVRNWSIWLDIVILVRTVRAVLKARGAY